ncbi:hypothetical protein FRB90_006850 [Tulasnella sp. 427]|nr:hypothetical protein FRB90_006850 [Tulasnella sp. 427]
MSAQTKLQLAQESETPENRSIVPLIPPDPNVGVALTNVQGDVYPTFPKKYEAFNFFTITNADAFRKDLGNFQPSITTSADTINILQQIQQVRLVNIKNNTKDLAQVPNQFNIAFSQAALTLLNIGDIGDPNFKNGMLSDANAMGDLASASSTSTNYVPRWDQGWLDPKNPIHGVIAVASQDPDSLAQGQALVTSSFSSSIKVSFVLNGKVRDDPMKGHEYFGFLDGVSQPSMNGLVKPHQGQLTCDPGVIIHGLAGDPNQSDRPSWALGGSILAFRQLQQDVDGFNQFCQSQPFTLSGDQPGEGAARRGAKMFGRWASGCPLDLSPANDNTSIAENPEQNNNFNYSSGEDLTRCPVTGHIRKMAPRVSRMIPPSHLAGHLIVRTSIPYGPEVPEFGGPPGPQDRGLLFTSYQSTLIMGFTFIQETWANNVQFPFGKDLDGPTGNQQLIPETQGDLTTGPGYDPIIGANSESVLNTLNGRTRFVRGEDPNNLNDSITIGQDWILARGGEYFWVPSLNAVSMIASNQPMPGNGSS